MIYDIQRASLWKRISALIFDFIILGIVTVGVAFLLSSAVDYDGRAAERDALRNEFEAEYGVDFDIKQSDYNALPEAERQKLDDAYKAFATDPEVNRMDVLIINLTLIIISFSILISYLLLEILVPMKLKNGQTLGKKIFGIGVMRADGVKLSTLQLLIRTILGKYTLETMIPVLLILMYLFNFMPLFCVVGLGVLAILEIICMSVQRIRAPIHDAIAGTVTVDIASQLIFDTAEELMEYKKKLHAEAVNKAEYN